MSNKVLNFKDKLTRFTDTWSPKVIGELNDYQFKLAKFHGEFVWHQHDDTDEAFIVIKGNLEIALKEQTVHLCEGEMYIVPKGVLHKPSAAEICEVLLIEPKNLVNTGNTVNELTAENDVWV
ncbi:MAG: cupin domain-containing protein [Pseudomonadota bacterium]